MDYREPRFHARGVYPTRDTSRMGTARVKEDEEADTRIIVKSSKKSGRKRRVHEGEKSQTRPNLRSRGDVFYYKDILANARIKI